jgi:hypothetical protein
LHGDKSRRAESGNGSGDLLSKYVNKAGTTITLKSGQKQRISEVNKSGLGGGGIVTIDQIDFGIEVCLDHGNARLANYYKNSLAAGGEPKIQVQLVPSCGMSIKAPSRCCVTGGYVFNVDRSHCVAQQHDGTALDKPAVTKLPKPNVVEMEKHFKLDEDIDDPTKAATIKSAYGHIVVFKPYDLPARETV